ncbi:hypothetical protein MNEG_10036 [Monoraphidium neglectum]|jgi:hypothetical protein|uniref:Uncharacterized protein n=1 Tax=Monoraphidium neglectum TaxID=145388 RepID=A0A0D2MAF3_9CHLO|nr:hypothetical protein MNEG_10036 [Monoraphidium neglectum]KIY97926.1 hypothetical protein MNEG_10036 [Monoraphidium neglectum]|eukprot:XP_013896946.1 hypothetical protein MNEG_10036 [Monoraphidium neglectum]
MAIRRPSALLAGAAFLLLATVATADPYGWGGRRNGPWGPPAPVNPFIPPIAAPFVPPFVGVQVGRPIYASGYGGGWNGGGGWGGGGNWGRGGGWGHGDRDGDGDHDHWDHHVGGGGHWH